MSPAICRNTIKKKRLLKKNRMLPASMLEEVPQPVIKHPLKLKPQSASDISATDTGDWKKRALLVVGLSKKHKNKITLSTSFYATESIRFLYSTKKFLATPVGTLDEPMFSRTITIVSGS